MGNQGKIETGYDCTVRCDHVSKFFSAANDRKNNVLDDISLKIQENEFVVVFGPGQCGKTTLLNIIAGLENPSGGNAFFKEQKIQGPGKERGMVYQTIALFPWLTVVGNVEFGLKMTGMKKKARREKAQHYIDLVGLKGFEKHYPVKLSGGMRQRVGIARAYCNSPELILMDEPFGHLDAQTRYLMEEEIGKIWSKEKKTVLFVTNNIEEAVFLADRILLLSNCPTRIKKEYIIDLPRPRSYTSEGFLKIRQEISQEMDLTL